MDSDKYSSIVQLVIHAENISWNRFNNFLLTDSVLVIAWATIYSSGQNYCASRAIQYLICLLGVFFSISWAMLAWRSRDYVDMYFNLGRRLENGADISKIKLFQRPSCAQPYNLKLISSRFLTTATPIFFAVLYLVMIVVTWCNSGVRCCF
jgi:hypothetical protein